MILIYIDHSNGMIKKSSIEAISYGVQLAKIMETTAVGLIIGNHPQNREFANEYGLEKIYVAIASNISHFDNMQHCDIINQYVQKLSINCVIITNNIVGKSIAPRLAYKMDAGLITNVVDLPTLSDNQNLYKKIVFSGKAFLYIQFLSNNKIISLSTNSFTPIEFQVSTEIIEEQIVVENAQSILIESKKTDSTISLTEANIVVSGGRGLKGPENWGMIEELAKVLGAATACSRPVADADWRPHHEHVGQTGLQISPNLYIAIGISGAIQHLAGVNRSKCIVVINKDPEAPFIKAADYAIIGDAFEIVPKFIKALKDFK